MFLLFIEHKNPSFRGITLFFVADGDSFFIVCHEWEKKMYILPSDPAGFRRGAPRDLDKHGRGVAVLPGGAPQRVQLDFTGVNPRLYSILLPLISVHRPAFNLKSKILCLACSFAHVLLLLTTLFTVYRSTLKRFI